MGHAELSHHLSGSCDDLTEPSLFSSLQGNFLKIQMNSQHLKTDTLNLLSIASSCLPHQGSGSKLNLLFSLKTKKLKFFQVSNIYLKDLSRVNRSWPP